MNTLAINSTNIISVWSITIIRTSRIFKHVVRWIASLASSRIITDLTVVHAFYEKKN